MRCLYPPSAVKPTLYGSIGSLREPLAAHRRASQQRDHARFAAVDCAEIYNNSNKIEHQRPTPAGVDGSSGPPTVPDLRSPSAAGAAGTRTGRAPPRRATAHDEPICAAIIRSAPTAQLAVIASRIRAVPAIDPGTACARINARGHRRR